MSADGASAGQRLPPRLVLVFSTACATYAAFLLWIAICLLSAVYGVSPLRDVAGLLAVVAICTHPIRPLYDNAAMRGSSRIRSAADFPA